MAQEKSFINETRKRGLINRRRVLVHCATDFDQRIDQLLRRKDVAQPQGRIKNFTHRPRVNHPAEIDDSLQTRERWPGKAELRVKVVFKNECIVRMGKI